MVKRHARALTRSERRSTDRPADGDLRPCPFCRTDAMTFFERQPVEDQNVPVWICTSESCGYRTLVRQSGEATHPRVPGAAETPREDLARQSANLRARARRLAMKSRARVERTERLLDRATEIVALIQQSRDEMWIETDGTGTITQSGATAMLLTGYSARSLRGRPLQIMFVKDRPGSTQFRHVLLGHPVERQGWIRPRERRAIHVRYRIELIRESKSLSPTLRWTFEPIG